MEGLAFEFAFRASLIVLTTAMMLRALRIRSAAAQHAVWAGVLMAMLALPVWLAWGPKAAVPVLPARSSEPSVFMTIADPTTPIPLEISEAAPAAKPPAWNWPVTFFAAYMLGAFVLLLRLAIGTIRARRLTSESCAAPVTVGLLRPRIILPASSSEWAREQLDAVLTHEREHARRRDPLFQWLALFNRAVFWFHPLAWWLERKLSALAEEACDAAVLERGHDPREYSRYLLEVARAVQQAGTRVNVVAMAMPGSYLPQRVKQIIDGVRAPRISRARMACAGFACAIPAAVFAAGTLGHMPQLLQLPLPAASAPQPPVLIAQAPAPAPAQRTPAAAPEAPPARLEFEVASLRPTGPRPADATRSPAGGFMNGGPETSDPGQISYLGVPLSRLLITAFGITQDQLSAPDWVMTNGNAAMMPRFDVVAKVPPGATKEQANEMLKNLLVDRFHLTFHTEKKEFESYVLVVAKGGPKLKPAEAPDGPAPQAPPDGSPPRVRPLDEDGFPILPAGYRNMVGSGSGGLMRWTARMTTTAEILRVLQGPLGIRNLADQNGLTGKYDFKLEYSNTGLRAGRGGPTGAARGDASDPIPDLFEALEKQLGLKLEKTKTPLDVVVIDHIDKMPVEN